MSEELQYIIVALLIAAAVGWTVWRLVRRKDKPGGSCCGCSMSETCSKRKDQPRKD